MRHDETLRSVCPDGHCGVTQEVEFPDTMSTEIRILWISTEIMFGVHECFTDDVFIKDKKGSPPPIIKLIRQVIWVGIISLIVVSIACIACIGNSTALWAFEDEVFSNAVILVNL
jgi:hypothetical protein